MASNTENLNLLMKNPSTDGADTFNVQTMLNENWKKIDANAGTVAQTLANILKPTTPPIIGLPPSTTPDGMFQALGNTGELHVWRKTVANGTGTYSLGAVQEGLYYIKWANYATSDSSVGTFEYGSEVSVDNDGAITGIKNPSTITIKPWYDDVSKANVFKGKFIKMISQVETSMSSFKIGEIWWIPTDAMMTTGLVNGEGNTKYIATSKRQQVIGIPAGTTTTYPVSTNPKAYQEGSDAKPAGYVVGEVETGKFKMSATPTGNTFYVNSTIEVTDDGTITFPDGYHFINIGQNSSGPISARDVLGNFMSLYQNKYDGDFEVGDVWFIPSDATISDYVYVNKRQRVTGYAAIPASTTIEYLGKLGEKARVQVLSYVGTGTYGSGNPNSLTFDFVPKAVFLFSADTYNKCFVAYGDTTGFVFDTDANIILHVSWNGKNISWFNTNNELRQHNKSGYKYRAIAIG